MTPDEVLASIEREAPQKWPIIIGPVRGKVLDDVVLEHRPSVILEVGALVGYSAIRMGRHLGKGGKLVSIEVSERSAGIARRHVELAGLSDRISFVVGDAESEIPRLGLRLDMVFLDAVKSDYLDYLRMCEPMMHSGSVVAADNVRSHPVELAGYLRHVRSSGRYESRYVEPEGGGDAVEVSVMR